MKGTSTASRPDLVGGRLSLDFVNSEGGVRNGPPEWIETYDDLLEWSVHAGGLEEERAAALRSAALADAGEADDAVRRALDLREALYRLFTATLDGRVPDAGDRQVFTRELRGALSHLRPEPADSAWEWGFDDEGAPELDRVIWPIVRDAADLLTSDELQRVKECSGSDCSWLFVDQSRNRSRRWCDMAVCGNRSKVRRHYERTKEAEDTA